ACSFMLCDLDFEPLSLSLSSLPSCDLVSLTNMLILLHYLESFKSEFAEARFFMLCDLDFEPLSLSLSSLPSCDLMSLTNMLILLPHLESFKSELAEVFVFKS
ncbi:hypothetical protein Tco_1489735, partial [Tanacetum coccineum]